MCLPCPAPCSDCRSNTRCLACQPGYFLNGTGRDCIKQCPQQTFSDSSGGLCQSCHSSCQTCHGPRSANCDLCLGYFLGQDSSCVVQCPSGSYANTATQLCEDCSPSCEACLDTSDNCISCSKGSYKLFLHQGRCWSNCPEGLFETAEGLCEACDSSCLSCDGIKSQCLSCADGHYLESGMCRLNCSLRTYPADDATCRRCSPHCDVCSDDRTCFSDCSGPLADDCETCSTFSPKLYKGTCSKDCPTGTYYETEALECQGKPLDTT
uniref:EGF-like domain-containing protein n=1 Tax=Cyclopterus lumpus TaxID=8103 RepID=A0A8C2WBN3_CYCLU